MHCLSSLGHAFHHDPNIDEAHVAHCLGYLRNAALCAADVTLEPGALGMRNFTERRSGATHICRDWKATEAWMIKNWKEWKHRDGWKRHFLTTDVLLTAQSQISKWQTGQHTPTHLVRYSQAVRRYLETSRRFVRPIRVQYDNLRNPRDLLL